MTPMNWKDTLNLPQTDFPMKADLAQREPDTVRRWDEAALYRRVIERRRGAPRFTMHDGPPYANGHIHHGHILNKILKDIVVKYHNMSGRLSEFIPGWDCHGLPIEHEVEKRLGSQLAEMTDVEIRRACRDYAVRFVSVQEAEFKRLGVLADWSGKYTTLDHYYEATILRLLSRLAKKGLVYKALRPVHWSYGAGSALADAEVEYAPFTAPSIYVRFRMPEPPAWLAAMATGRPVDVVIWTTTPWTLAANLAIAMHPEFDYLLVDLGDSAIVVAEGLAPAVFRECRLGEPPVLGRFKGSQLVGLEGAPLRPLARHPFVDRDSVLLPAEYVTLDQGTGNVHTAPGHGQEDYDLGRRFGLDVLSPVDDRGRYTDEVPEWAGVHVFDANPKVVQKLHALGALLNEPGQNVLIERYPHCWRTKLPVIFRATPQWFVSVDEDDIRGRALRAVTTTQWIPAWGQDRIRGMLESRPDWCISRQRVWGVPIPAVKCIGCGEDVLSPPLVDNVAAVAETRGVDAWFEEPLERFLPEGFACPRCGAGPDKLDKQKDILDVWFESGSSFAAVLDRREGWGQTAQLYLEGSDQHRGWFHHSLLLGVGTHDVAPFEAVLTHGFVMDEQGRKYSKSSQNFEPPEKLLNTLGAEILRLWVAAVDYRGDITLSPEILRRMVDAYRRIRNTARFLLGNLSDFDPARDAVHPAALPPLDAWALDNLAGLLDRLGRAYRDYEYHVVFHRLLEYCTVDLSQNYLDVLKDRLYCESPDDPRRRASQTVLYEIVRHLALLSAPILSFTAEEIWQSMPRRDGDPESVHLGDLPAEAPASWLNPEAREAMAQLLAVRAKVLEAIEQRRPKSKGERLPGQLGSTQEARVVLSARGPELDGLRVRTELLEELLIVSEVAVEEGEPDNGLPAVAVDRAGGDKCPRCWNYRTEYGANGRFPALCRRCAEVVVRLGLPELDAS
jgi:isoleucyl-tRNA synthetase